MEWGLLRVASGLPRVTNHVGAVCSALGDAGKAVRMQQGDGSSIESEDALITKDAEQTDGGFNGNPGHLGHFFPFERKSHADMIVTFFTETITEIQQQHGQSLASRFERELIEVIHINPDFVTEELDQLDRQLRIAADDREIAFLIDDADLRGLQCLACHFMQGAIAKHVLLDQFTGAQDADNLPPASRRRASELDLARAEHIQAQAEMPFVEHRLVRRIYERTFNRLKLGEIAFRNITQDDLRAKLAGIAIFDEAGLSFHGLPILGALSNTVPSNRT